VGDFLWVGLGGCMGAVARYAVALAMGQAAMQRFPWPTFAVNAAGCLAIGLLAGLSTRVPVPAQLRLFLVTGLLGGFTTFSAFGLESLQLLRRGEPALAAAYVAGSVAAGLLAVWLGWRLAGGAQA
jgi:crcB protein